MILTLAKGRELLGLTLFLLQMIPLTSLVIWHETHQVVKDGFAETTIAIGTSLTSFVVVTAVTTVVMIEGSAMLYESFARRLRKMRIQQGRAIEYKRWRDWYETVKAEANQGKPLPEPLKPEPDAED